MMSAADDPETERKAYLYGADEFLPDRCTCAKLPR